MPSTHSFQGARGGSHITSCTESTITSNPYCTTGGRPLTAGATDSPATPRIRVLANTPSSAALRLFGNGTHGEGTET
jgi:hypothetical protein